MPIPAMAGLPSTRAPGTGQSSLRYLAEIDGPVVRVTLRGRLDVDTVWSFGAELLALIRAGRRHLSVDLSPLDDVSSICVGVVNRAVSELKLVGGTLTLCGADESMMRRLRAAGLHPAVLTPPPEESAAQRGKRVPSLSDTA